MWGLLGGLLLYGSNRPRTGNNAGGTLVVVLFFAVWIVAGVIEVVGALL